MNTTLPAVQYGCKYARTLVSVRRESYRKDKRNANRRHRRHLNGLTRGFTHDPERFDDETFIAPSMSAWDVA